MPTDKIIGGQRITDADPLAVQLDSTSRAALENITIDALTVGEGADVNAGATTDAAATAGGTGTISAKLRVLTASIGAVADAAWVSGSGSVIALLKSVRGALPAALGQGTAAQSLPVVDAADTYTQPDNGQVTLTTGQTNQIVAAAGAGVRRRTTMIRCDASSWYVSEGVAAATTKFLVPAGATLVSRSLLAINGWPVTGSPVAYVISEAAS